jgi:hypothetical protein
MFNPDVLHVTLVASRNVVSETREEQTTEKANSISQLGMEFIAQGVDSKALAPHLLPKVMALQISEASTTP